MKTTYPECSALPDGSVRYRFTCRRCLRHGEWRTWLSEAEDEGERHVRVEHGEAVAVA